MDQNIINYVSEQRQQGVSDQAIKASLQGAGWAENDISQALGLPLPPLPNMPDSPASASVVYVGAFSRLGSVIIDGIIIRSLLFIPMIIFMFMKNEQLSIFFNNTLSWIITAAYLVLTVGKTGQTWGKRLCKQKIVTVNLQPVGYGRALLRYTVGYLISGLVFGLGFLWIIFDKRKQGWHDKIAGTIVIR